MADQRDDQGRDPPRGDETRPRVDIDALQRRRLEGDGFDAPNQTLRINIDASRHKPSRTVGSLLIIAGTPADIGKHILLEDDSLVIGRAAEGLHLRDGNISRRHACIERRGNDCYVSDLGSTNGTLVNGNRASEPIKLADGDTIVLGQTVLKFHMVDETEASYHHQVQKMVTTDDATGLSVKRHYDAIFGQAVQDAVSVGNPLCAMMAELDTLKMIIDRHGHAVGQAVVRDVAGIIKRVLASYMGEASYFGGGEFSVFVPNVQLPKAMAIAEEIRRDVERGPLAAGLARVATTLSIGVARLPEKASDPQALLRLADAALFRARSKGRNRVSD